MWRMMMHHVSLCLSCGHLMKFVAKWGQICRKVLEKHRQDSQLVLFGKNSVRKPLKGYLTLFSNHTLREFCSLRTPRKEVCFFTLFQWWVIVPDSIRIFETQDLGRILKKIFNIHKEFWKKLGLELMFLLKMEKNWFFNFQSVKKWLKKCGVIPA